ncbi:cytochrome P450 6l1-like, partial [Centruroides sculpturatus]|uniref:cytochrome P450 6l1-like n=1 Tax=Centruroides sculpturatus TaxID=218467 RepID=UPI000C6DC257
LIPKINECVKALEENLYEVAKDGKPVNCTQHFNVFVMDSISRCAFNMVIDSRDYVKNPFVNSISNVFSSVPWRHLMFDLTRDEIISQCILFFIVGFATTAANINFIVYSLALNPECQEKLAKELQENLQNQEELEYEDVQNLPYLDAVISETLRYYSPTPKVIRMGHEDYHLEGTDIVVPK